jgi:hypothetical protein
MMEQMDQKKERPKEKGGPKEKAEPKKTARFFLPEVKAEPSSFPGGKKRRKKGDLPFFRQKNSTFFSPGGKSSLLFPPLPAFPSATCFFLRVTPS